MTVADDTRHLLLALRLKGAADTPTLESALGVMESSVEDLASLLGGLERAGLVECPGAVRRWRLTPEGRSEGERLLAAEVDTRAVRGPLTQAYQAFLGLNGPLLRVCTDWQLRNADPSSLVVNDHTDAVYDQTVLERLDALRRRVLPICEELAAALPRLGHYGARLSTAEGVVDHFHAVWFELHEDLLATLGLDRSTEPLPDTGA